MLERSHRVTCYLMLACVGAWLCGASAAVVHRTAVAHEICAEHGSVVEVEHSDDEHAHDSDAAEETPADEHEHGCDFDCFALSGVSSWAVPPGAPIPAETAVLRPVDRPAHALRTLRVAPKTSPPLFG